MKPSQNRQRTMLIVALIGVLCCMPWLFQAAAQSNTDQQLYMPVVLTDRTNGSPILPTAVVPTPTTVAPTPTPVPEESPLLISHGAFRSAANGDVQSVSIAADGRFVAFASLASNLVANDNNGYSDVFVYDAQTDAITLVSINMAGKSSGNHASTEPSISADGRYVAFVSRANNLFNGDINGYADIFLRDLQTGTTTLVMVDTNAPSAAPQISADGSTIVFTSSATNLVSGDSNGVDDVFAYDIATGIISRVSLTEDGNQSNGTSSSPSVSADGRYVAFQSAASNLVASDTNNADDIFVRDMQSNTTTRVSLSSAGVQTDSGSFSYAPSVSGDGRYIVFRSNASNLIDGASDTNAKFDIFLRDTVSNTTTLISKDAEGGLANGNAYDPKISRDGSAVVYETAASDMFANDTNDTSDVLLYNLAAQTNTLLSRSSEGVQGDEASVAPSISGDGSEVAFISAATNFAANDTNAFKDLYIHEVASESTKLASVIFFDGGADGASYNPRSSADGRYIVFDSQAGNLVAGDKNNAYDVFLYDVQSKTTKRISVSNGGAEGNDNSYSPSITDDGRYITFISAADNLVEGDANNASDVFLYDAQSQTLTRITAGNDISYEATISADGSTIAFRSAATDLVANDNNSRDDVFVYRRADQTIKLVSAATGGGVGNGTSYASSISADGRYIAFVSWANDLVTGDSNVAADVFVRDTQNNTTQLVSAATDGSVGDGGSYAPSISADGRYIAFLSLATNLTATTGNGELQVFLRDTQTNSTTLISGTTAGEQGDGSSYSPSISADGRYIAFASYANNLVAGDSNNVLDIFLRDTQTNSTTLISVNAAGELGDASSYVPSFAASGDYIVYYSEASNIVEGDLNGVSDVFRYKLGE